MKRLLPVYFGVVSLLSPGSVQFGCMLFVLVSLAPMAVVSGSVADALLSALGGEPLTGDEDLPPSSTTSENVSCLRISLVRTLKSFFVLFSSERYPRMCILRTSYG